MEEKKSLYELFTLLLLGVACIFYRLFVITKIWTIIAIPMGAPAIGLKMAWGISSLLMGAIATDFSKEVNKDKILQNLTTNALGLSLAWWVAHLFFT